MWLTISLLGASILVPLLIVVARCCQHEWALQQRRRESMEAYDRTHPPITDEEFLRLCGPGVSPELALKFRDIVAEISCVEKDRIYPDARLIEDLGLD